MATRRMNGARMLGLTASLCLAGPVLAEAPTGTITGTVRLAGPVIFRSHLDIVKDAAACGARAPNEAVVVGPDKGLANVVVSIQNAPAGKPPAPTPGAAVDQVGCRYLPHVQVVTVGTTLALLNNDAVLHNVHGTAAGTGSPPITVFNVAMPFKGQRLPTVLKKPGVLKLRCDAGHSWMSAYVHVFSHSYFAVTDAKGAFTIENVPPGKYSLELWHEPVEEKKGPVIQRVAVEVEAGKTTAANSMLSL